MSAILVRARCSFLIASCLVLYQAHPGTAGEEAWQSIKQELFGQAVIEENSAFIAIDAPEKSEDAAVVPISVTIPENFKEEIAQILLVIDRNPSPIAAVIDFGPAAGNAGRRLFATRVRMDTQSPVRAVMRTADGHYYMTNRIVNAAGGCSAASAKDSESSSNIGEMRIKVFAPAPGSTWLPEAQVMVRHPNHNGMQLDAASGLTIPARFVEKLKVTSSGRTVFEMTAGISLSANPNIRFTFAAQPSLQLATEATDSAGHYFTQHYPD
jgi:sulfur-oxidizing protein SoxY